MKKVNVEGVLRLPAFSHAVVAGGFIYVSGTLGTVGENMKLAEGGIAAETLQTLKNIQTILSECGVSMQDIVKMNVFLKDADTFAEMNEVYTDFIGDSPPARITVSNAKLGLDAAVEIDCIAYKPAA